VGGGHIFVLLAVKGTLPGTRTAETLGCEGKSQLGSRARDERLSLAIKDSELPRQVVAMVH